MANALFNPYRTELNNVLNTFFDNDKYKITKSLIHLCKKTKIPMCSFDEYNEQKSKIILKHLDKYIRMCYHNSNKCKHYKKGCELIGLCRYENI